MACGITEVQRHWRSDEHIMQRHRMERTFKAPIPAEQQSNILPHKSINIFIGYHYVTGTAAVSEQGDT